MIGRKISDVGARPTLPGKRPHSWSFFHMIEANDPHDEHAAENGRNLWAQPQRWRPAMFRTTLPCAPGTLSGNDGSNPSHINQLICNVMTGARRWVPVSQTTDTQPSVTTATWLRGHSAGQSRPLA